MTKVCFVTGNASKAAYLEKYLGLEIDHQSAELEEIQSMDLHEIVKKKLYQAYDIIKKPVLVEDVSLEFCALGRFPGPFIKFLLDEASLDAICRSLDGMERNAISRCVYGYYDGATMKLFEGKLEGSISEHPMEGPNGYAWDHIFIADGYKLVRSQLNDEDYKKTYLQIKPIAEVREFLQATI